MKMRIYPAIITFLIISFSKVSDAAVATLGACDMREAKIVYQLSGPEIGAAQPKITFKKEGDTAEVPAIILNLPTPQNFHTGKAAFPNLLPDSKYEYFIKSEDGSKILSKGAFKTKPDYEGRTPPPEFTFLLFGSAYDNQQPFDPPFRTNGGEYEIFDAAKSLNPAFAIWADGATMLKRADCDSRSGIFARYINARNLDKQKDFLANVPNYGVFSKSSTGVKNISAKSKTNAAEAFDTFWANPESTVENCKAYSFEYADAEFFVLDDVSNRDTLDFSESVPQFLGERQLHWLFSALANSSAKFKVVVMGSPALNPAKSEENFTKAERERNAIIEFSLSKKISGLLFLSAGKPYGEITRLVRAGAYPIFDVTAGPVTARPAEETSELNYFRLPNSGTFKRSFVKIDVIGPENSREIKFTFIDSKGTAGFSTSIKESDMNTFE